MTLDKLAEIAKAELARGDSQTECFDNRTILALIEVARAGDVVRHEMVDRNGAFLKLVDALDTLHALTGGK